MLLSGKITAWVIKMNKEITKVYSVSDILAKKVPVGARVAVNGLVRTRRDSKVGMSFIALHDGSCFHSLQIVAETTLNNYDADVLKLSAGCAISVIGELVVSPAKGQAFEVHATEVRVDGFVEDPDTYPISPKRHTLEYLREHAHLRMRTNTIGAVSRIRQTLAFAIHQFFNDRGFYWLPTPIITSSDCEGAGEMFRVTKLDLMNLPRDEKGQVDFAKDYFGKETFLTVSGQLNAEAYAAALSKVYTFGPTFRAEDSNTSRHLAEFWMVESEIAFADLQDVVVLAEDMIKFILKAVLDKCEDDMTFFAERIFPDAIRRLETMVKSSFVQMTYTDAIDVLLKSNKQFEFPVAWGADLQSEHERYLAEEYAKNPVVIVDYPKEIKAFYMRLNDDNKTVTAMDVLVPGMGEIIGGSQREERLDVLERRIAEAGVDKSHYKWYLELRRYGTMPHAGYGMGFERMLGYITGMTNIRDLIPFPRFPKHAEF